MRNQESNRLSRRQALAASFGAMGTAALTAQSAAAQRPERNSLKGKKVLVCVGEFSEGMETYYMVFRLMEEGVKPVVAAKDVKLLQMVVHDFDPCYSNYIEMEGYKIEIDIAYSDVKPADFVRDLLDVLDRSDISPDAEALLDAILNMAACKAAIKAGQKLTDSEIEQLLADRHSAESVSRCPHGRPTTIKFSVADLERQFKRT